MNVNHVFIRTRKTLLGLTVCSLTALTGSALAGQLVTNASFELHQSDNVLKGDNDKSSETEANTELGFAYTSISNRLVSTIGYQAVHREFKNNLLNDRTNITGSSLLQFDILPRRFIWVLEHNQDYNKVDSTLADTADNRDERSTVQTGPDLNFNITPVDMLTLRVRQINTDFDSLGEVDSERLFSNAMWVHRYSQLGSISLVASHSDVQFDAETNDYTQKRLGLGLDGQIKQGRYNIQVGGDSIDRNIGPDVNGSYIIGELNLEFGRNQLEFRVDRETTDSSIGLSLNDSFSGNFTSGDTNFNRLDVVERTRLQVFYQRALAVSESNMTFGIYQDEEDFDSLPNDQKRNGIEFGMNYSLTSRLSTGLEVRFQKTEFIGDRGLGEDKDFSVETSLSYDIGPSLSLRTGLSFEDRSNNINSRREYDEFSAFFGIYYTSQL